MLLTILHYQYYYIYFDPFVLTTSRIKMHTKKIVFPKNTKATTRVAFILNKVGMARFELATSSSQTRRDNRATLHPERKNYLYGFIGNTLTRHYIRTFCGEGGIRTHGTV
jgi:hypothetical protein